MDIDFSRIKELVDRPGESLSVELKRWIDPDQADGIAKIVKAVLALRNHGGGYMVIGFNNETLEPDTQNIPPDVKGSFHIDKIQGLISKFASEPFEIAVKFPERAGQLYPVIIVPSGIKTPVAAKSDLHENGKKHIAADTVFVRSLNSNNTPSTTRANWKDWPNIAEVCFDNREADIGRFLRRHLSSITPDILSEFATSLSRRFEPEVTTEDLLRKYLKEGEERFATVVTERGIQLPDHGVWEVALLLVGDVPRHTASQEFLSLIDSSNPRYTGWPAWLDSRGFIEQTARPYIHEGVWEALLTIIGTDLDHLDFMRLDPKGRFYLRRALQDDISSSKRAPEPMTVLDFGLPIIRTAEAIAVGIAFAKAMGCNEENTLLAFSFKWSRLKGRALTSWAKPDRYISGGRHAYQDEVLVFVDVPLETPLSALNEYVSQAIQPLFEVFEGFQLSNDVIEDLTRRLVERRL